MRFLLLNQAFHPDVVATAQYLSEVAAELTRAGHEVRVIAGRRAYDDPAKLFPARESWRGVEIHRVLTPGLGKRAKWKRALDFAMFMAGSFWRLMTGPKPDHILALTSPPLIAFLAAGYAAMRPCRFTYWIMDFNPDEAIAAGWLRPDSPVARMLNRISTLCLQRADTIIVLDRFMRERVIARGIAGDKVFVIPPWSQDNEVAFDPAGRERFRDRHQWHEAFVVMYSGNHSPCHPLETLLAAALELSTDASIRFCFVGGGSEFGKVERFSEQHRLGNITCLPYQPLAELGGSLSAADLHVVVMGDAFVGTIHPCKIYNALAVGAPLLYIGPHPSHVTDLYGQLERSPLCGRAAHGDSAAVIRHIRQVQSTNQRGGTEFARVVGTVSRAQLLPKLIALLTHASLVGNQASAPSPNRKPVGSDRRER